MGDSFGRKLRRSRQMWRNSVNIHGLLVGKACYFHWRLKIQNDSHGFSARGQKQSHHFDKSVLTWYPSMILWLMYSNMASLRQKHGLSKIEERRIAKYLHRLREEVQHKKELTSTSLFGCILGLECKSTTVLLVLGFCSLLIPLHDT